MKTSQKIKQNVVNNLTKTTLYENVTELLRMQQIYEAGIKEVRTKLEILDAEFKVKHDHNPIHHIESRLKSPESILKKAIAWIKKKTRNLSHKNQIEEPSNKKQKDNNLDNNSR